MRNKCAVKPALEGQSLLRPSALTPKPNEIQRQQLAGTDGNLFGLYPW